MTLLNKIFICVICSLLIVCGVFYYKYTNLNKLYVEKELETSKLKQNEIALIDKLNAKTDTIQNISVMVKKINDKNSILSGEYVMLTGKYTVLKDSIYYYKKQSTATETDSTIVVNFNGCKEEITYFGNTDYNKKTKLSTHTISIQTKDVLIDFKFYMNKDKIFKIKLFANGRLIKDVDAIIDSNVFNQLYESFANKKIDDIIYNKQKNTFIDKLKIYGDLCINGVDLNNIKKSDLLSNSNMCIGIGMTYEFDSGFSPYIIKYINHSGYSIGVQYTKTISNILKMF